jgi:CRISPR-associated endonuclease Csn1
MAGLPFLPGSKATPAFRGAKKRNYVLKNAKEAEERFRTRNLNDTRYAARLLAEAVKLFYPEGERQEKGGSRRVFTRPGGLTAALRHAWGWSR